jgi:hypothetical protein
MSIDYKTKLSELIDNSKLTLDQKELWKIFIMNADEYEDEAIYEAASMGEDCLLLLTDNLRDKVLAMASGKKEDWDKVIEGEEKYLESLKN